MSIKNFLEFALKISIVKTIRFNFAYFGWGGVCKPKVICSRNVKLERLRGKVIIENPEIFSIKIGFGHVGTIDSKYQRTMWENNGTVIFKGRANLGAGCRLVNSGNLIIGKNFYVNGTSSIIVYSNSRFGDDCLISWDCLFMDTDFHSINSDGIKTNHDAGFVIGNHVWIGCRSTILKGTMIGNDSVVAAGSVISKKYSEKNAIVSSDGIIKSGIDWS